MCDPTTILLTVGTVVSSYGSYAQGEFQGKVANNNAVVADRMAKDARDRGRRKEMDQRLKTAQIKSQQRAAFGASGRDISGSASDILADTAMIGELDALTIRSNTDREVTGYETQASNLRAQGKYAKRAGRFAAGTTLLTGAVGAHASFLKNNPIKNKMLKPGQGLGVI